MPATTTRFALISVLSIRGPDADGPPRLDMIDRAPVAL
jgi:hypothetical protein